MTDYQDIVDCIERLWGEGKTDSEIVRFLAERGSPKTRNAVIGIRHRHGWPANSVTRGPAVVKPPPPPKRPPPAKISFSEPEDIGMGGSPTLFDLRRDECHWPVGRDGEWTMYCGAKSMEDGEYCKAHYKIGHTKAYKQRD
jgi:hypothetical protein